MNEMNITSAQWVTDLVSGQTQSAIRATIDGVQWSVPIAEGNRHYAAIMQAVADGQLTIQEASE